MVFSVGFSSLRRLRWVRQMRICTTVPRMRKRAARRENPQNVAAANPMTVFSHPPSGARCRSPNPMKKAFSMMASAMSAYSPNLVP